MSVEINDSITWNRRLELYFADTGEKAHCLSWIHRKSEEYYSRKSVWIDLPVIIFGTLNGAVSVGSKSLFGENPLAPVGVGIISLFTAILSTIGSYFAFSRKAEGHRISALSYGKLYRFLSIEMALPREERMRASDLLKFVKNEYDRLTEISPLIPPLIVKEFKDKFSQPQYDDISKPEDTNGLHAIEIYTKEDAETPHVADIKKTPVFFAQEPTVVPNELVLGLDRQ